MFVMFTWQMIKNIMSFFIILNFLYGDNSKLGEKTYNCSVKSCLCRWF